VTQPEHYRTRLRHRGFWLEYASMGWMTIEAAVAIASGIAASSIALIGFGLDSVIEFFAAVIVVWQLRGAVSKERETRAVRLIGATFFALAAYLVVESVTDRCAGACRLLVTIATPAGTTCRIQHRQFAAEAVQHDFGRVAILTVVAGPFAGLQCALEIDLRALAQVLLGNLDEPFVKNHDPVPLGALLALTGSLVPPAFRCSDVQVGYALAAGG